VYKQPHLRITTALAGWGPESVSKKAKREKERWEVQRGWYQELSRYYPLAEGEWQRAQLLSKGQYRRVQIVARCMRISRHQLVPQLSSIPFFQSGGWKSYIHPLVATEVRECCFSPPIRLISIWPRGSKLVVVEIKFPIYTLHRFLVIYPCIQMRITTGNPLLIALTNK
jgi:hypothetical protein